MKKYILIYLCLLFAAHGSLKAKVVLPAIFGDHMVLQQNAEISLWGWANPREELSISTSWDPGIHTTTGSNYGRWQLLLKTPAAGGPHSITIKGSNTVLIEDILIGEVWLASGQSNMEWAASYGIDDAEKEIAEANHPNIRFFQVSKRAAEAPQIDLNGHWEVCSPESMKDFSAVGYFFARRLKENLKVPVGIINSSWGGTPAEAWIPADVINEDPILSAASKKISEMPWCPEAPGSTYNAMIAPLLPFKIAGVLWYQGETNTANHEAYHDILTALITNWRSLWDSDFHFYYVQIAPYKYETPEVGVRVREAQRQCLKIPKTGMVVVSDIGNTQDIHPTNKQDVGLRLANWALARHYGKNGIVYSGPLYSHMQLERNKLRLFFEYADNGLEAKGGPLTHFEIAGADGIFSEARTKISGNSVLVWSGKVKNPTTVRFAWSNTATPNLFNSEGLPASSFSTATK